MCLSQVRHLASPRELLCLGRPYLRQQKGQGKLQVGTVPVGIYVYSQCHRYFLMPLAQLQNLSGEGCSLSPNPSTACSGPNLPHLECTSQEGCGTGQLLLQAMLPDHPTFSFSVPVYNKAHGRAEGSNFAHFFAADLSDQLLRWAALAVFSQLLFCRDWVLISAGENVPWRALKTIGKHPPISFILH